MYNEHNVVCEKIKELLYKKYTIRIEEDLDMWYVGIVYVDGIDLLCCTYSYFFSRYEAERWFSEKVKNMKSYYGTVCGEIYWKNTEFLEEIVKNNINILIND